MRHISLVLLSTILWFSPSEAATTIAVDPTTGPTNIGCTGTVTTCATGSFTASNSNELLIFFAICGQNVNTSSTVTSVTDSGPGLTWTKRKEITSGHYTASVWYAQVPGSFTGAVTANWTGCASGNSSVGVFGVKNVSGTPWDSNAAIPAQTTGSTANPTVGPITTTSTNTMLLSFVAGAEHPSAPSGWTAAPLGSLSNFGGCCLSDGVIDYRIVSTTQSAVSATYTNIAAAWITIGDALVDVSQPATGGLMKSGPGW